jgi:hypothetical protein
LVLEMITSSGDGFSGADGSGFFCRKPTQSRFSWLFHIVRLHFHCTFIHPNISVS